MLQQFIANILGKLMLIIKIVANLQQIVANFRFSHKFNQLSELSFQFNVLDPFKVQVGVIVSSLGFFENAKAPKLALQTKHQDSLQCYYRLKIVTKSQVTQIAKLLITRQLQSIFAEFKYFIVKNNHINMLIFAIKWWLGSDAKNVILVQLLEMNLFFKNTYN